MQAVGLAVPEVIKDGTSILLPESNNCCFLAGLTLNAGSTPHNISALLLISLMLLYHIYINTDSTAMCTPTHTSQTEARRPVY